MSTATSSSVRSVCEGVGAHPGQRVGEVGPEGDHRPCPGPGRSRCGSQRALEAGVQPAVGARVGTDEERVGGEVGQGQAPRGPQPVQGLRGIAVHGQHPEPRTPQVQGKGEHRTDARLRHGGGVTHPGHLAASSRSSTSTGRALTKASREGPSPRLSSSSAAAVLAGLGGGRDRPPTRGARRLTTAPVMPRPATAARQTWWSRSPVRPPSIDGCESTRARDHSRMLVSECSTSSPVMSLPRSVRRAQDLGLLRHTLLRRPPPRTRRGR